MRIPWEGKQAVATVEESILGLPCFSPGSQPTGIPRELWGRGTEELEAIELAQQLGALVAPTEDPVNVPAPTERLKTNC